MASTIEIDVLRSQLVIARSEISNLRTQLNSLTHKHQKDVEQIKNAMQVFKCESCKSNQANIVPEPAVEGKVEFNPIGVIKTIFPEKRAVPRQANVAAQISSKVELLPGVFTNPLHSLEGLEEFSHIWLIYHFHKNEPHTKAKISPPRLEGEKVGVFCTRSPHRPNPIGISLVQLEKVEGSSIFFLGTDMVNDTPVLDIKPYIPQYDNPAAVIEVENFAVAQRREEPEGEETVSQQQQNSSVRVPQWVSNKKELIVEFNETALGQLASLHIDKDAITQILQSDPRSVYLKSKYSSQIYTFQLLENNVTCKFDDINFKVTVLQLKKSINVHDQPEN